ncbi:DJ-1/PfpI family protein [Lederbergia wuyishanensis]|uniref:Transcriptional regulator GlxA family with amidase domain n=1 Tax=Lederbergia wuyishanensis TaxID=1347903 RepID=A0ABU0D5N5_9BACI|nr:DJ-1/PfpI family protein [Lederbergia wuyishanensis]MCJ8008292.1 DJ-1/PfpI family protein [Lederbergia wuyishanensis]MDQ0343704.1 transcriptional regulator GlxA family with amidase domain [Lederbergia wuyishanensis]
MMKQFHVGILLFNDVDAMDFVGPYEVFNLSTYKDSDVSKLFLNQLDVKDKPFKVNTVSQDGELITVHNGLKIHPDYSFKTAPSFDIVVIPGGPYRAVKTVSHNEKVINWIANQQDDKLILSVCTGALFLAKAGLLNGKQATTNQAALDLLEKSYPEVEVIGGVKFVDQGNVVTAAGISAGIDMSLHVVGRLLGNDAATRTANAIEYHQN